VIDVEPRTGHETLYDVLVVPPTASRWEIRKVARALRRNMSAGAGLHDVCIAEQVLGRARLRTEYDALVARLSAAGLPMPKIGVPGEGEPLGPAFTTRVGDAAGKVVKVLLRVAVLAFVLVGLIWVAIAINPGGGSGSRYKPYEYKPIHIPRFDPKAFEIKPYDYRIPKIEIPKFEMPKIEIPKYELPKYKFPKIEIPKIEIPKYKFPKIEIPKIEIPRIGIPKSEAPTIEASTAEAPKTSAPKVLDAPPVEAPKADVPKVLDAPPAELRAREPAASSQNSPSPPAAEAGGSPAAAP